MPSTAPPNPAREAQRDLPERAQAERRSDLQTEWQAHSRGVDLHGQRLLSPMKKWTQTHATNLTSKFFKMDRARILQHPV